MCVPIAGFRLWHADYGIKHYFQTRNPAVDNKNILSPIRYDWLFTIPNPETSLKTGKISFFTLTARGDLSIFSARK